MRPRPTRAVALLALLLAPLVGCGQAEPEPRTDGLRRDEFIDVVVAIRRAEFEVEEGDSADVRFQARRDSILAAHDLTEEDLYEFVERHPELGYIDAVWDSITERLKRPLHGGPPGGASTSRGDTSVAPETTPPSPGGEGLGGRPRSRLRPGG